jgi:hypothetical protein
MTQIAPAGGGPLLHAIDEPFRPGAIHAGADPKDADGTDGDKGDGTDGTDGSDADGTDGETDADGTDGADSDGTDGA